MAPGSWQVIIKMLITDHCSLFTVYPSQEASSLKLFFEQNGPMEGAEKAYERNLC